MNIIICYTPLQVLIAEKIVEIYPEKSFYGVLITFNDNDKFEYYFHRLKQFCVDAEYLAEDGFSALNKLKMLFKVRRLGKKIKKTTFEALFLASIDNAYISLLVNFIKYAGLKTFDDGTANISYQSSFYQIKSRPFFLFLRKILGINSDISFFKNSSKLHYSIYADRKNIIDNVQLISLFDMREDISVSTSLQSKKKIFLGQGLFHDNVERTKKLVDFCISKFEIDEYFPHPREKTMVLDIPVVSSPYIFEDYLIQYLSQHQDVEIEIYSLMSSCVLNISGLKNVKCYMIFSEEIEQFYPGVYQVFYDSNIPIVRL